MSYNDRWNYARVCTGKVFYYSVCENGTVIKTSRKLYKESKVKPYLKRGHAVVKINGKEHTLKNLVASKFIESYRKGDYVEVIDGDPFNCHVRNLRLYSQAEHGRRTGYRSSSQPVIVNGVEYRSIRECAKALHVSYQTVLDYLSGDIKHSVLQGVVITRKDEKLYG